MDQPKKEPLPIPEENGMCGKIAATVLNKKGYNIPVPSKPGCLFASFFVFVQNGITNLNNGTTTIVAEGDKLPAAKQQLARKTNDGVVLMEDKSNRKVNHFIPFIVEKGILNFYDADNGYMNVYRVEPTANAVDIDTSFDQYFPQYKVVSILFIVPPSGGRKTRRRKRKTRKLKRRHK